MAEFPKIEEMGEKVAEKALDEFLYDGKSIREWAQIIASKDAISRQAVLDILKEKWNMFSDANDAMQESIDTIESLRPVSSSENPNKCDDCISRQAALDAIERELFKGDAISEIEKLPPVTPQETVTEFADRCKECGKMKRCRDCKYFEYDSLAKVDGVKLIVAHEICSKWGDGCKTSEDGYCFLFEPKEDKE